MTYVQQTAWGWPIAIYLFLGGLGGATAAFAVWGSRVAALAAGLARRVVRFGLIAGIVAVGAGTLLLVADLVNPWHLLAILGNPASWIFWGVVLLTIYLVLAATYLVIDLLPGGRPVPALAHAAAVVGLLVALYTGFLVSSAPAIPFWNTPALPLLFLVSAASTAAALLLVYGALSGKRLHELAPMQHLLGRLDVALIGAEVLILLAYLNFVRLSPEAARRSAHLLLGSPGFLLGFLLAGLLLPWGIEIWDLRHSAVPGQDASAVVTAEAARAAVAGALVLLGGLLLRHYILAAGIFGYPFPAIHP